MLASAQSNFDSFYIDHNVTLKEKQILTRKAGFFKAKFVNLPVLKLVKWEHELNSVDDDGGDAVKVRTCVLSEYSTELNVKII